MSKTLSRAVDHLGFIRQILRELAGYTTLAFELIQNADDIEHATRLRFDIRDEALWVEDDGGFSDCGNQDLSPDDCLSLTQHGHRCDGLAARRLVKLNIVAFTILESCDASPVVLGDSGGELHALLLEATYRLI
jgi:hypothetical protein